jgi:hypothetical protein
MFANRIAPCTAAAIMTFVSSLAGVAFASRSSAVSEYKAGLTALRIIDTPSGPWTVTNAALPAILIKNDTVLLRDPRLYWTQQFLPKMIAGPVTVKQRLAAAALLQASGVLDPSFDLGDRDTRWPPGSHDTVIELTVSGQDRHIVAHALDAPASGVPTLTAAQRANRKQLTEVIAKLLSASRWNIRSTSMFRPSQYSAWGVKLSVTPTYSSPSAFDLSSFGVDTPTCIAVSGKDAELMAPTAGPWLSWGASTYHVVMRPQLPGEKICPASS